MRTADRDLPLIIINRFYLLLYKAGLKLAVPDFE